MGESYDLIVIGAGPGGYVAALRAAQLGLTVALIERDALGGVCLNWGCIPTKALLHSAEVIRLAEEGSAHGLTFEGLGKEFGPAMERSRKIVTRLNKGVAYLLKQAGVEVVPGTGQLAGATEVIVTENQKTPRSLKAKHVLLATGSRPRPLKALPVDGKRVFDSKGILALKAAPTRLAIIGGGPEGVEFASIFHRYGSQVTLLEMEDRLLLREDQEVAEVLKKSFAKRGIIVLTGAKVSEGTVEEGQAKLQVERSGKGKVETVEAEAVLVSVGRLPNVEDLGLDEAGVELNGSFIKVNDRMETSAESIFAIGDVIGEPMLAHAASHEGIRAVECMAGLEESRPLRYDNIPNCVFSDPEVASVGLTEDKAREKGLEVSVGTFPLRASGKALALGETEGLVKIVADSRYGEVLGAHMVGPGVTELIATVVVARQLEATAEEVARTVFAHPTLSESIMEAALAAVGMPIHT
jgi:dihydrolipoamide dehydrogenase